MSGPGVPPGAGTPPEPAEGGTRRWRLVVAYDGAGFRGFADQPGQDTVAGALSKALARTARLGSPPALTCAGRTDAGVHARHQVVHVDLPESSALQPPALARALNRQLAPSVVVRSAEHAPQGFDARRSATSRSYRYLLWSSPTPDPLLAPIAWHVPGDLSLRAMASAADSLLGEHDFRALCRRPPGSSKDDPIVRRVVRAEWDELAPPEGSGEGRLLRFDIEAGSFCHQMVRSTVSVLVEVGRGRMNAADLVALLRSAARQGAPDPAPPWGLCLVGVGYPVDPS